MGTRRRYAPDAAYSDYEEEPEVREEYTGGKFDGVIKAIGISILTAGIIAFIGMCFALNGAISNLDKTTAVLSKVQEFQQVQLDQVSSDLKEIRGRVYRGDGSVNMDSLHAIQSQP